MTAQTPFVPASKPEALPIPKRQWGVALSALRKLLADKDDTGEVFEIMRALNGASTRDGYLRLLSTAEGGRIAYERAELAPLLADRAWLASLPPGSVGAEYARFTAAAQITPQGLVEVSSRVMMEMEHPIAWFGRRTRDAHDLWHVLAGYGTDSLGEACLVAFSYAQTRSLGWAFIAVGAALKSRSAPGRHPYARAIFEGYQRGRRAAWIAGHDYRALLPLPLEDARARLGLTPPRLYQSIPAAARDGAVPKG
ncbi:MAG: Coq4 family protein [Polymorphobacter sp.]|uniref:Coq4 family protein n=1 Tax=Polymorphobacter sp. TaxID=1909290 RepID=UPI003A8494DE